MNIVKKFRDALIMLALVSSPAAAQTSYLRDDPQEASDDAQFYPYGEVIICDTDTGTVLRATEISEHPGPGATPIRSAAMVALLSHSYLADPKGDRVVMNQLSGPQRTQLDRCLRDFPQTMAKITKHVP